MAFSRGAIYAYIIYLYYRPLHINSVRNLFIKNEHVRVHLSRRSIQGDPRSFLDPLRRIDTNSIFTILHVAKSKSRIHKTNIFYQYLNRKWYKKKKNLVSKIIIVRSENRCLHFKKVYRRPARAVIMSDGHVSLKKCERVRSKH